MLPCRIHIQDSLIGTEYQFDLPSCFVVFVYVFRIEIHVRDEADRTEGLRFFLVSRAVEVSLFASMQDVVAFLLACSWDVPEQIVEISVPVVLCLGCKERSFFRLQRGKRLEKPEFLLLLRERYFSPLYEFMISGIQSYLGVAKQRFRLHSNSYFEVYEY